MLTRPHSPSPTRLSLIFLYKAAAQSPRGSMLFLVTALLIALSGLFVAYSILAKVHSLSVKSTAASASGFYSAEAVLNKRAESLRNIYFNYAQPSGASPSSLTACFAGGGSSGSGDYACESAVFKAPNQSMSEIAAYSYVVADNGGLPIPGNVPTGETFQGLNMQEYRYTINAVAKKDQGTPTAQDQVITKAQLVVKARLIPMFQFAAFYANDLEILPGPAMTLSGPVHTNKSLYLGANETLTIKGQVTVANDLFNKRKNDNSAYPDGRVKINNLLAAAANLLFGGTGSTSPTTSAMNPTKIADTWGNRINLGIQALSIPKISTLGASGDFYKPEFDEKNKG